MEKFKQFIVYGGGVLAMGLLLFIAGSVNNSGGGISLGGTTNFDSLTLSDNLVVDGTSTLTGATALTGAVTLVDALILTESAFCIDFYATSTATQLSMTASSTATIEGVDGVMMFNYGSCQ